MKGQGDRDHITPRDLHANDKISHKHLTRENYEVMAFSIRKRSNSPRRYRVPCNPGTGCDRISRLVRRRNGDTNLHLETAAAVWDLCWRGSILKFVAPPYLIRNQI